MARNLLNEFDQELYDSDDETDESDDEDFIPIQPELDANGNWHYSFSFDNSDIIYVVWNESRVFHNNVEVGFVGEFGVVFFPLT